MKLRRLIVLLLVCVLCTSCTVAPPATATSTPDSSAAQPSSTPEPQLPTPDETEHPMNSWSWVDDATAVAIEKAGAIRYVGLDNKVKATAQIPAELLCERYSIAYGDSNLFVLRQGYSGKDSMTRACLIDGEWKLYNSSVHKRDGTTIKQLESVSLNYDKQTITVDGQVLDTPFGETDYESIKQAVWINDRYLAVAGTARLFFYDTDEDKLTLAYDCSGVFPEGNDAAYYGIRTIVPQGNGCLYFAHDIEGRYNNAGRLYYQACDGDRQEVALGNTFGNMTGNDGIGVTTTFTNDPVTGDTAKTEMTVWDNKQRLVATLSVEGGAMYRLAARTEQGIRVVYEGRPLPDREEVFYLCEIGDDGSVTESSYKPEIEGMYQYELVTVRGEQGGLEYIFSATSREQHRQSKSYTYNEQTKELTELSTYVRRLNDDNLFASPTHYVEFIPDFVSPTHMAVRPFK